MLQVSPPVALPWLSAGLTIDNFNLRTGANLYPALVPKENLTITGNS